ncbi:peptide-methionine (S)-S-oxide reductase MsrA [Pedobacter sp. PWIIR3]
MRNLRVFLLLVLSLSLGLAACRDGQHLESKGGFAVLPNPKKGEAIANFSGGCFWATQECMIELKGVRLVVSGYAGGTKANPTYDEVTSQQTGHAESVQVYYDPTVISFNKLATAFFHAHDPTQVDGQGPDRGSDYRSIAFFRTEQERNTLDSLISEINEKNNYAPPVATELIPFTKFYPGESYHQDYYKKNSWEPYVNNVSKPKVLKLRKALPELIKSEYQD